MTLNYFFPTRWAPTSYKRIITPLTGVIFHTSYPFIFVHWYGLYTNITPFRTIVMRLTLNSLAHFFCSSDAGLSLVLFQYGHLACGGSEGCFGMGLNDETPGSFTASLPLKNDGKGRRLLSFLGMVYFQGNCETSGGLGKDRSVIIWKYGSAPWWPQAPHTCKNSLWPL